MALPLSQLKDVDTSASSIAIVNSDRDSREYIIYNHTDEIGYVGEQKTDGSDIAEDDDITAVATHYAIIPANDKVIYPTNKPSKLMGQVASGSGKFGVVPI